MFRTEQAWTYTEFAPFSLFSHSVLFTLDPSDPRSGCTKQNAHSSKRPSLLPSSRSLRGNGSIESSRQRRQSLFSLVDGFMQPLHLLYATPTPAQAALTVCSCSLRVFVQRPLINSPVDTRRVDSGNGYPEPELSVEVQCQHQQIARWPLCRTAAQARRCPL